MGAKCVSVFISEPLMWFAVQAGRVLGHRFSRRLSWFLWHDHTCLSSKTAQFCIWSEAGSKKRVAYLFVLSNQVFWIECSFDRWELPLQAQTHYKYWGMSEDSKWNIWGPIKCLCTSTFMQCFISRGCWHEFRNSELRCLRVIPSDFSVIFLTLHLETIIS